jgi:hypothetical protein
VFVTTTDLLPAVPTGVRAVIEVALATMTLVAATPPIVTVAPDRNPEPAIVKGVFPAVGPTDGVTVETTGPATYVNEFVAVPPGVVTTTVTTPAACAGVTASTRVGLMTVNDAGCPSNVTDVVPIRRSPLIVTVVFPVAGPKPGVISAIIGPKLCVTRTSRSTGVRSGLADVSCTLYWMYRPIRSRLAPDDATLV